MFRLHAAAILFVLISFIALTPHTADAVGSAADAMCISGDYTCKYPAQNKKGEKCMLDYPCSDLTNQCKTTGTCARAYDCTVSKTCEGKAPKLPDVPVQQSGKAGSEPPSTPAPSAPAPTPAPSPWNSTPPLPYNGLGAGNIGPGNSIIESLSNPSGQAGNASAIPNASGIRFGDYLNQQEFFNPQPVGQNPNLGFVPNVEQSVERAVQSLITFTNPSPPAALEAPGPGTLNSYPNPDIFNAEPQSNPDNTFGPAQNPAPAPQCDGVVCWARNVVQNVENGAGNVWSQIGTLQQNVAGFLNENPTTVNAPRDPETGRHIAEAADIISKVNGWDTTLFTQYLGGICNQESNCNPNVVSPNQYKGLGQLNENETTLARNTLERYANSPNLTTDQQAIVRNVVAEIDATRASGFNPNTDPRLGAWLLAARQTDMPDIGKNVNPFGIAIQYTADPREAAQVGQLAQLAPSTLVNFNPDRQLSGAELTALRSNRVDVSAGNTVGDAISAMGTGFYARNLSQGVDWATQFTGNGQTTAVASNPWNNPQNIDYTPSINSLAFAPENPILAGVPSTLRQNTEPFSPGNAVAETAPPVQSRAIGIGSDYAATQFRGDLTNLTADESGRTQPPPAFSYEQLLMNDRLAQADAQTAANASNEPTTPTAAIPPAPLQPAATAPPESPTGFPPSAQYLLYPTTPQTPEANPLPPPSVAVGDSIAQGFCSAGLQCDNTRIGASPSAVLRMTQNVGDLTGQNVVLSTGASNNPSQVGQYVPQQIQGLLDAGAAHVTVLGVGTQSAIAGANTQLDNIVTNLNDPRVSFSGPLADLTGLARDQVHPNNYNTLLASISSQPVSSSAALPSPEINWNNLQITGAVPSAPTQFASQYGLPESVALYPGPVVPLAESPTNFALNNPYQTPAPQEGIPVATLPTTPQGVPITPNSVVAQEFAALPSESRGPPDMESRTQAELQQIQEQLRQQRLDQAGPPSAVTALSQMWTQLTGGGNNSNTNVPEGGLSQPQSVTPPFTNPYELPQPLGFDRALFSPQPVYPNGEGPIVAAGPAAGPASIAPSSLSQMGTGFDQQSGFSGMPSIVAPSAQSGEISAAIPPQLNPVALSRSGAEGLPESSSVPNSTAPASSPGGEGQAGIAPQLNPQARTGAGAESQTGPAVVPNANAPISPSGEISGAVLPPEPNYTNDTPPPHDSIYNTMRQVEAAIAGWVESQIPVPEAAVTNPQQEILNDVASRIPVPEAANVDVNASIAAQVAADNVVPNTNPRTPTLVNPYSEWATPLEVNRDSLNPPPVYPNGNPFVQNWDALTLDESQRTANQSAGPPAESIPLPPINVTAPAASSHNEGNAADTSSPTTPPPQNETVPYPQPRPASAPQTPPGQTPPAQAPPVPTPQPRPPSAPQTPPAGPAATPPASPPAPSASNQSPLGSLGNSLSGLFQGLGSLLGRIFGNTSSQPQSAPPQTLQQAPGSAPGGAGGGGGSGTSAQKPIVTLIANPLTIEKNARSLLTWASVGLDTCSLTSPEGAVLGGPKPDGSTSTPALATTTVFSISCSASSGATAAGTATVTVH